MNFKQIKCIKFSFLLMVTLARFVCWDLTLQWLHAESIGDWGFQFLNVLSIISITLATTFPEICRSSISLQIALTPEHPLFVTAEIQHFLILYLSHNRTHWSYTFDNNQSHVHLISNILHIVAQTAVHTR